RQEGVRGLVLQRRMPLDLGAHGETGREIDHLVGKIERQLQRAAEIGIAIRVLVDKRRAHSGISLDHTMSRHSTRPGAPRASLHSSPSHRQDAPEKAYTRLIATPTRRIHPLDLIAYFCRGEKNRDRKSTRLNSSHVKTSH